MRRKTPANGDASVGDLGWWRVMKYWQALYGDDIGDKLEVRGYRGASTATDQTQTTTLLRPMPRELLRAAEGVADPAAARNLREATLRAAIIDTPWSAAFISYVIKQAGATAEAFQFANAHRVYIYDAFAASAAELTNKPEPALSRLPAHHDPAARGRSDLLPARARRSPTPATKRCANASARNSPAASRQDSVRRTHCDVVAHIDAPARKMYVIGGNFIRRVTAKKLNLRRNMKFSAEQKGHCGGPGHWTLPQPSAGRRRTPHPTEMFAQRQEMVCAAAVEVSLRGFDAAFTSNVKSPADGFCYNSATAFAHVLAAAEGQGAPLFPTRQFAASLRRHSAGRRRMSRRADARAGAKLVRLCRRGRPCGAALADLAVEGRAVARALRRGEAARWRAFADRARRQRRGKSRTRHGGPPYFWYAEVEVAGGRNVARDARAIGAGRMRHDHARHRRARRQAAASARDGGQRLAAAQHMESRDGKSVFGMDREAVRRAARRGAVVAGVACSAARPIAQFPVQPSGSRRRPDEDDPAPGLRRPAVLLARVFRVQDGIAVRLFEVLARRRRQARRVASAG